MEFIEYQGVSLPHKEVDCIKEINSLLKRTGNGSVGPAEDGNAPPVIKLKTQWPPIYSFRPGFYVDENHITKLSIHISSYFHESNLKQIPKSLSDLRHLEFLNIFNNPIEKIPKYISQLESLKVLKIWKCGVSELPNSVGDLRSLEVLDLSDNDIKRIPSEIGNLSSLKYLSLNLNKIHALPRELKGLTKLKSCDLSNNLLKRLPSSFRYLSSLEKINLSRNSFRDFPYVLSVLPKLKEIQFNQNRMGNKLDRKDNQDGVLGETSKNKFRFPSLSVISMQSCQIRKFPSFLMSKNQIKKNNSSFSPVLRSINLKNNSISCLPETIKTFRDLQKLNLCNNSFDKFPEVLCECRHIKYLDLSENSITHIPKCINKLQALNSLRLDKNRIRELPPSIGDLHNLYELSLRNNDLFTLPDNFGNLENLTILNLDENNLILLPKSFGKLTNLQVLDLVHNDLNFTPPQMGNLENLRIINFDWDMYDLREDMARQSFSNPTRITSDFLEYCKTLQEWKPDKLVRKIERNMPLSPIDKAHPQLGKYIPYILRKVKHIQNSTKEELLKLIKQRFSSEIGNNGYKILL